MVSMQAINTALSHLLKDALDLGPSLLVCGQEKHAHSVLPLGRQLVQPKIWTRTLQSQDSLSLTN